MNGYLLDTHSLIWWWTDAERLSVNARSVIESGDRKIVVSAASVWEIAIKSASGKLDAIEDFQRDYKPLVARNGFETLAMRDDHALMAGYLPGQHRDPFDRMLAAQAMIEKLTVITCDPQLVGFGCEVIW